MSKLQWDETGKRTYETGLDQGILYLVDSRGKYSNGVPWKGLISVTESPSGAEATALYADNIKYLNLIAAEDFGATIEAYTYPSEFIACDGSLVAVPGVILGQQARKTFGLAYRTKIGNDTDGQEHGYKYHLIYGALASPSERSFQTVNDSPEAITFSWTITTTPIEMPNGMKPAAHIEIDSTKINPESLELLKTVIQGQDAVPGTTTTNPVDEVVPYLPSPSAIVEIIDTGSIYRDVWSSLKDSSGHNVLDDLGGTVEARAHALIA